jgi:trehalose 6-phosphate phosphatase
MSHDAAKPDARWALFLDVDGTLLELAPTPERVYVSERLKSLLIELSERLEGAVALISGRTIADLDHLFAPLRFCASGIHGAERRYADGRIARAPIANSDQLASAETELAAFVQANEGLLLENKSFALALHYRLAPQLEATAREKMQSVVQRLGSDYVLQPGKRVFEVRPAAFSKGTAVRSFLTELPFAHRAPIYIGDDLTDEHAFEAVNALNGLSIRVGEPGPTHAKFRIPNIAQVHEWLVQLSPVDRDPTAGLLCTSPK